MQERITLRRRLAAALFIALAMAGGNALAQDQGQGQAQIPEKGNLEQRVTRLERIINNQGLVDMLGQIQQLQSEVEQLRGQIDVQNHTIDELKQRQRDLYADIDRRLSQLERNASVGGGAGAAAGSPSAAPVTGGTAGAGAAGTAHAVGAGTAGGTTGPGDLAKEQQAYQVAFDQLRELHYDQAIAAFQKFLAAYPHGRYAHIAQYWVAEANYAQRHFKQAIAAYQKLLDNYPNSPKRAEAMLKIGYSYYELGEMDRAQAILTDLMQTYPKTTESGQAQNLMRKIKVQGGQGK